MLYIALVCAVVGVYWLFNQRKYKSDEPPYLPGAWPIVGHLPSLTGDTSKMWTFAKAKIDEIHNLGGIVRFKLGPKTIYVVCNSTDIMTISKTCQRKAFIYDFAKSWVGDGLVTASGPKWNEHRKLLNPAFKQGVLDTFAAEFNNQARKLVMNLKKEVGKGLFNQTPYMAKLSLETVLHTVFGTDVTSTLLKTDYEENLYAILHSLLERTMKFWWYSPLTFRFSKLKKETDSVIKNLHDVSNSIIQTKKSYLKSESQENLKDSSFKSFSDILLELLQQGVFNDRQVREHTDTIIATGMETSSKTLIFMMLLLGTYPAVQEKAAAEVIRVLGDGDRDVEKKDFAQLVYVEAVIKETLRLYSPAPVVARQIDQDVKLRNCTIRPGHMCVIMLVGAHLDSSWGPDRHEFRPDPTQLPEDPKAFCAFSIGKRTCIGQGYAIMLLKTVVSHILRNYKISADISQLRLKLNTSLTPESGHFISIENRM